jgi:hypothetical protein
LKEVIVMAKVKLIGDVQLEFPSVWTNIHTYRPFKATRRGLRASMSPGRTLTPHNLSERLTNALRAYFFGGFYLSQLGIRTNITLHAPLSRGRNWMFVYIRSQDQILVPKTG